MKERRFLRFFLLVPSLIVLYFVFQIFRPFLVPVALAAILVTLSYPLFDWFLGRLKGRRGLAAFLTCSVLTLILILPLVLLLAELVGQVNQMVERIRLLVEGREAHSLPDLQAVPYLGSFLQMLEGYVDLRQLDLVGNLAKALQQAGSFFLSQSTAILSSLIRLASNFFILVLSMFFLYRDGGRLLAELKSWTPLSERYEGLIIDTFRSVALATVVGSLVTALAQGMAAALVYLVLGLPNVVLWATLTALLSLVPVVGTALVWVPLSLFLLATGQAWKALILVLLAIFFIGAIDNFLRPILIEGRAKMHTLLVFFSIMGGITYFGMVGMIFGPILVALGLTFLQLYKIEFQAELAPAKGK